MKIRVMLKDPDGFSTSVNEAAHEEIDGIVELDEEERDTLIEKRGEKAWKTLARWVKFQEYVELEFDTEAGTAVVCEVKR